MGVTYKDYSQFGNDTIVVSSTRELNAAVKQLASQGGGTVKVDPNGGPYDLSLNNVGSSKSPVLIESAGNKQAVFESMNINKSEYITINDVAVDTSHMGKRNNWEEDVKIDNSNNIELVNSSFTGSAKGYLSEATSGDVRGVSAVFGKDSEDINLSGNFFTNYMYNVKMVDVVGLEFNNNEVTQWQADAFHGAGLQQTEINDNYLHNPLGSTQTLAHTDFIQIRMSNADLENRDIEIARNIMDTEGGPSAQGIHMGTSGTNGNNYNISIHDNIIHTARPRGIGVDAARGLDVYNNTILWDKASWIEKEPGAELKSWDPRILVTGRDINLDDNVASMMRINNETDNSAGYFIQYDKPAQANHVDKHIANLDGSGNPNSYDLSFLKSSPIYGKYGAAMSSDGTTVSTFQANKPDPEPAAPVAEEPAAEPAPVTPRDIEIKLLLIDTEADEVIGEFEPGDTLDSELIGKDTISIVADTSETVGSARLTLGSWSKMENGVTYALYGNNYEDYYDAPEAPFPEAGDYSLTVELFENRNGVGKIGETTAEFSVAMPEAEAAATPVVLNAEAEGEEDDVEALPAIVPDEPEEPAVIGSEDMAAAETPEPVMVQDPAPEQDAQDGGVAIDEETGNIIRQLLDVILGLLGREDVSGSEPTGFTAIRTSQVDDTEAEETSLADVIAVTALLDEALPQGEEDDDETALAA
ncbi:MAG: hypothetical protein AAF566_05695 [Pseudomonadota bacterium]